MTQNSAEHTPGPWDIMEGRTLLHIETAHNAPVAGLAICSVSRAGQANARLIAAAPDLLEALERLVSTHCAAADMGPNLMGADEEPEVIAARAAIAKATGK